MALSRCTYRPEVVSSLLKRPPLKIPAVGFGFRGAGESYKTSNAIPLPDFRSDDLVTIRRTGGVEGSDLDWNHNGAVARSVADELLVSLGTGDWVAYDIAVQTPSRFEIAAAGPRPDTALDVSVDGRSVRGTTDELGAGRHVVRLTGRAPETLVSSVEISPVDGRRL